MTKEIDKKHLLKKLDNFFSGNSKKSIKIPNNILSMGIDEMLKEYYVPRLTSIDLLSSLGLETSSYGYYGFALFYEKGDYNKLALPIEKYQEIIDTLRNWQQRMSQCCLNYSGNSIEIVRHQLFQFNSAINYIIGCINAVGFVNVDLLEQPEVKKLMSEAKDLLEILKPYDSKQMGRVLNIKIDRFGLIEYYEGKEEAILALTNTVDKKNKSPWLNWWAWDLVIPLFLNDALKSSDENISFAAKEYIKALMEEQSSPSPKDMKLVFDNILRELSSFSYNFSINDIKITSEDCKFEQKETQEIYEQIKKSKKTSADEILKLFSELAINGTLTKFFIENPKILTKKDINVLNRFLIDIGITSI